jgi:hypothetical protein
MTSASGIHHLPQFYAQDDGFGNLIMGSSASWIWIFDWQFDGDITYVNSLTYLTGHI